jgi:hypothetical protein
MLSKLHRSTVPRRPSAVVRTFVLILLSATGCTDPIPPSEPGEAIARELFVQVIVDLRTEALRRSSGYLPRGEHEATLERHGVTEEDLVGFIDAHARNVPYMSDVWTEVERRIREAAESGSPPGSQS